MSPTAAATLSPEPDLNAYLATLPPATALRIRTLAHAWQVAGGGLVVGRLAVRLVAARPKPFTAGTLHVRAGSAVLELSRILLQAHGVTAEAWQAWCDERPELRAHGFTDQAKFPAVALDALPDGALARLALGLRDLGRLVSQ